MRTLLDVVLILGLPTTLCSDARIEFKTKVVKRLDGCTQGLDGLIKNGIVGYASASNATAERLGGWMYKSS